MEPKVERKFLTVSEPLHYRLRCVASRQKVSIKTLLEKIVEKGLNREEKRLNN